jgi:hypothetical protein
MTRVCGGDRAGSPDQRAWSKQHAAAVMDDRNFKSQLLPRVAGSCARSEVAAIKRIISRISYNGLSLKFTNLAPAFYLLDMKQAEHVTYAKYTELVGLVAEFDAGRISRTEFQKRARALPTELLVVLSEILTAGRVFCRAAAGASDSRWPV